MSLVNQTGDVLNLSVSSLTWIPARFYAMLQRPSAVLRTHRSRDGGFGMIPSTELGAIVLWCLASNMSRQLGRFGLTPREHRISALPSIVGSILVLVMTIVNGAVLWPSGRLETSLLLFFGSLGIAYLLILDLVIVPHPKYTASFGWLNAILTSIILIVISYCIPLGLHPYVGVLMVLAVTISSIIADRTPSYILIALVTLGTLKSHPDLFTSMERWTLQLSMVIMAIIIVETVHQLKRLSRGHIRRLETIAEFSRHISSTLDTHQVMALLSAAFQNAVEADTYFVGVREGDQLRLELCYDDGEYFENQRVKLDGSLSSWVLENQRSLFLPDLRKEVDLPGVRLVLVGKHKTSLSWLGVPMRGTSVDGIISIGSYRPNSFDRGDLELLNTLAQHAAQALDNTHQHKQVELRSQLDSLTGLYNHGNFLMLLKAQLDSASLEARPLGLIMLDVDNFKQYNDTYGHLIGDSVLVALSSAMRQHVKSTDAVARWGGEEFVISLPNADANQVQQVAIRICETMADLTVKDADQRSIPGPTVSQGFALFPREAENLVDLIHLADRRLYIAKARGRNQIEPDPGVHEV
jgi:diguanylate cyclase (GGDEF)-like protein